MRALFVAAVALAQIGCHECAGLPGPPVAVCVAPVGGWYQSTPSYYDYEVDLDLAGPALEVGDDDPPDGCLGARVGAGSVYSEQDASGGWWLRVADDTGARWTIGILLPGTVRTVEVGEAVSLRLHWGYNTWGPDDAHFELRDGAGDLVAWAAEGYDLDDMEPPVELTELALGLPACSSSDECGSWIRYALEVSVRGHLGLVPLGGSTRIDGLRVFNVSLTREKQTGHCDDWGMDHALLAAAR